MFSSKFCPILAIENLKKALDYSTFKKFGIFLFGYIEPAENKKVVQQQQSPNQ
jgi:hypothetical protein